MTTKRDKLIRIANDIANAMGAIDEYGVDPDDEWMNEGLSVIYGLLEDADTHLAGLQARLYPLEQMVMVEEFDSQPNDPFAYPKETWRGTLGELLAANADDPGELEKLLDPDVYVVVNGGGAAPLFRTSKL